MKDFWGDTEEAEGENRITDPVTGEILSGSVDEEALAYQNMETRAEESQEKLWMIPFADLMSTLVILFLALFGYAMMEGPTGYESAVLDLQQELAETKKPALVQKIKEARLAENVEKILKEKIAEDTAKVEITAQRIRISLATPVFFDTGRADLKPEADGALGELAELLREIPNPVQVDGHTDNTPPRAMRYRSNFELSAARAFSVIDFLIRRGLDPKRFSAYGYGEFRPVADNALEDGRRKNRRIEISILRDTEPS